MAPLPQARVVLKPGTAPALAYRFEDRLGPRVRGVLAAIIGLWPITAVLLLMFGLAWLSAMQGSP